MRRIVELDSLRGLAALAIVIYHLKPQAMPMGWAPVDLFMVLSGYLITTIILGHAGKSGFLMAFYARRTLRIWPLYFLALGAIVAVNPVLPKRFPLDALPYYATFTQNLPRYWSDSAPAFNWYFLHSWSIALEEQFYLIWPALIALLGRRGIVPAALGLVGLAAISRAEGLHWWLLASRCDGFALGGLLAYLLQARESSPILDRKLVPGLTAAAVIGVAGMGLTYAWSGGEFKEEGMSWASSLFITSLNVANFGVVGLVVEYAGRGALRPLRMGALTYLGRISYGLYLLHPLVIITLVMAGRRVGLGDSWWIYTAQVAACVVVASLSWQLFEKPVLKLKDRFAYPSGTRPERRSEPATPAVGWAGNG